VDAHAASGEAAGAHEPARDLQGLSDEEVRSRRHEAGDVKPPRPSRSYWSIARANLFTVISIPLTANYFGLVTVGGIQVITLTVGMVLWFGILNLVWRANVFDRLFTVDS